MDQPKGYATCCVNKNRWDDVFKERTRESRNLARWFPIKEARYWLTPNHSFLIQEVVDHLDTVSHLNLCLLGHGKHGAGQLTRLEID